MADYQRTAFKFPQRMNLSAPVDQIPQGAGRLLYNCRVYGDRLQSRQGIQPVTNHPTAAPVHSICSFNDPIPNPTEWPNTFQTHTRIAGVSTYLELCASNALYGSLQPGYMTVIDSGYSGNPLSFVTTNSQYSPRPWTFIGDSNQMRKTSSGAQNMTTPVYAYGIAPPNFAPTAAYDNPNADGPDIGTTNNPYVYRIRARADSKLNTGAVSNLGPPMRDIDGLSPSSAPAAAHPPSNILITIPSVHPDPQVRWLDIYRYGGSITEWTYIGTVSNFAGATILDSFNDLSIAANQVAEFDDNQPFLSVDTSKNGVCNVVSHGVGRGGTVNITSGDVLRAYSALGAHPYYPLGNQISINGALYTFYRSPDSPTSVEVLEDFPANLTAVDWVMTTPDMMAQSLPCIWGPFGGGLTGSFVFGCGDSYRPGALYWTKGNHPESHPGRNVLDITTASEPLMNGVVFNGNAYVFSTTRMFSIYPSLGQVSDFVALEVPNSRGLFARWGLTVTPWGIAFIGKDGIYITSGGQPVSLTDEDLYPIFPHETSGLDLGPAHFPNVDGLSLIDLGFFPVPDFSRPDRLRLAYGDGFLYFDYLDQTGIQRTLVGKFNASTGKFEGWVSRDTYNPEVIMHYFETYEDFNVARVSSTRMLVGTKNGYIGTFSESSYGIDTDFNNAISWYVMTSAFDTGDPRPRKQWGDIEIDINSFGNNINAQLGLDGYTTLSPLSSNFSSSGRKRFLCDINTGRGQYAYNIGLILEGSTSSGQPVFYMWGASWLPKPELSSKRVTDWTDCGYVGAKFFQGFKLRADTLGDARTVQVLDDLNANHTFTGGDFPTVNHNGEQTIAYSFDVPFISHLVRFAPTDDKFWRIENIEWIFEPAPELVRTWTTQETTHDFAGWLTHRDSYWALESYADVILTVNAVGNPLTPFTYTITNTNGLYDKIYLQLTSMKCRAVSYSLTSTCPFRVYQRDLEVRVKEWGSTGKYLSKQPMGDLSRINGARI